MRQLLEGKVDDQGHTLAYVGMYMLALINFRFKSKLIMGSFTSLQLPPTSVDVFFQSPFNCSLLSTSLSLPRFSSPSLLYFFQIERSNASQKSSTKECSEGRLSGSFRKLMQYRPHPTSDLNVQTLTNSTS
jgi:hypothetical protein